MRDTLMEDFVGPTLQHVTVHSCVIYFTCFLYLTFDKCTVNAWAYIVVIFLSADVSRSGKLNNSEILFGLMVKIFKKNVDEWVRTLTTCILPNDGKGKKATKRHTIRMEVGRFLMVAVTRSLDAESKSKYGVFFVYCFGSRVQFAIK